MRPAGQACCPTCRWGGARYRPVLLPPGGRLDRIDCRDRRRAGQDVPAPNHFHFRQSQGIARILRIAVARHFHGRQANKVRDRRRKQKFQLARRGAARRPPSDRPPVARTVERGLVSRLDLESQWKVPAFKQRIQSHTVDRLRLAQIDRHPLRRRIGLANVAQIALFHGHVLMMGQLRRRDPLSLPIGGIQQPHRPTGRRAPEGIAAGGIPHAHFPEAALAARQRSARAPT